LSVTIQLCVALEYVEAALEAERRLRRGDRQFWCGTCNCWRWPEECVHAGRLTEKAFKAWVKSLEKGRKGT